MVQTSCFELIGLMLNDFAARLAGTTQVHKQSSSVGTSELMAAPQKRTRATEKIVDKCIVESELFVSDDLKWSDPLASVVKRADDDLAVRNQLKFYWSLTDLYTFYLDASKSTTTPLSLTLDVSSLTLKNDLRIKFGLCTQKKGCNLHAWLGPFLLRHFTEKNIICVAMKFAVYLTHQQSMR